MYRIEGLARDRFESLIGLSDEQLGHRGARRVIADDDRGFPCRVSLEEASAGERLILLNFASLDVPTPFRTTYGIFVREEAVQAPVHVDRLPAILEGRILGLRGFDAEGMLRSAALAAPGEVEDAIDSLFGKPEIATIHAHNAAYGCFLARIERN